MFASQYLFSSLWPHVAQSQNMFTGEPSQFDGTTSHIVPRLTYRTSQVRTLQVLLVSIGVVTLILILTHPDPCLRRDPGSLASVSIILGASPELDGLLSQTGKLSEDELREKVKGRTFHTEITYDDRVVLRSEKCDDMVCVYTFAQARNLAKLVM
jgi:hypothetical protein